MSVANEYPICKNLAREAIEQIGVLPSGWVISRNLGLFGERKIRSKDEKEELLSVSIAKGVTTQAEMESVKKDSSNEDKSNYKQVKNGDIVYNKMRMWQGAVGYSCYEGIVSPAYIVLDTKNEIDARYYSYLFKTKLYNEISYQFGHGIVDDQHSLRYWQFKSLYSIVPPAKTQEKIAKFLDNKKKKIDQVINKKQELIDLLREERISIIAKAVTKGINLNEKMKNSGVEWIGNIPEGWEVKPGFLYISETKRKNTDLKEQNLLSLSYGEIVNKKISSNFGLLPSSFETYQVVFPGQIIFRLTDLQNDKKSLRSGLVKTKGIITSAYVAIKIKEIFVPDYLNYVFRAYDAEKVFYTLGSGVRQSSDFRELKKLPLALPPKKEQNKIIIYLDTKTEKIDECAKKIKEQIEKLKEYRASLIYNAVTGKIKI